MAKHSKKIEYTIWKLDFDDLAKQICLKDMELFKAITIEEIDSFNWNKENKKSLCPNLMIYNSQFNKINLWVQKEILEKKISLTGIKVLAKFINLSKRLLDLRNFQSAYAVKSALLSQSIYRLENLWSEISKKDKTTLDRLDFIFDVEDNHKNLRQAMDVSKKPCIPYLGVYLFDLINLDSAHPKINNVESETRKTAFQKIYSTILHFQSSKYDFKLHPDIQDYLKSMEYMEEFKNYIVDRLFNLSEALEPDVNSVKSPTPSQNYKQSPKNNGDNHYRKTHIKSNSLDAEQHEIYRKITDCERGSRVFNNQDSVVKGDQPTMESQIADIINLLDDSVVEKKANPVLPTVLTQTSLVGNGSLNCPSPITNHFNTWSDSQPKFNGDMKDVQYVKPEILKNDNENVVFEGSVRRKMKLKSSTFCMPSYQKVLAKLTMINSQCFIGFHTAKISKPKAIGDFQDEPQLKIKLTDATVEYENFKSNPKIRINLPHEIYVLKSVDEAGDECPTIDKWWEKIDESLKRVPLPDLINLNDDFTRL